MFGHSARYLVVVALLAVALGAWLVVSKGLALSPGEGFAGQSKEAQLPGSEATEVVIVDVEGWYRRTQYERALSTAIDFTLRPDLFSAIPGEMESWRSQGADSAMGATVDEWYDDPEVAATRHYISDKGDAIFLSIIGSRGGKSFHLFEHTALTCYPGSGWRIADVGLEAIEIGESSVNVQRVVAEKGGLRRVILYWYLWTDPERSPDSGILSVTLHADIADSEEETLASLKEFFTLLFPGVMPWSRLG